MKDELNILEDDLHLFCKCKTTSISLKMEDDLNSLQMKDYLNIFPNARHPQSFGKKKTTSNIWNME